MLLFFSAQAAGALDDFSKKLDHAKELIDSGKLASARPILRELIRRTPNNADAHMELGAALAADCDDGKYDEAISEELKAIELDPKSSSARRILGMIYANQHKPDEAIALLQESCKLNPSSFASHRDLATAYLTAGKIDDAILTLKKALELKPESASVHMRLASIFSTQNKFPEAIAEATEAVKLNHSRAEAHLLLANIKLQAGDSLGAVESFKTAIEANGCDSFGCKHPLTAAGALSGLGWALTESNAFSNATLVESVSFQQKAIKADPHFLPAHVRLAELLVKQNKLKNAEAIFQRIFTASGCTPSVGLSYARFLASSKRNDEARAVLKKVLEKSPDNKQASDALAALEK